MKNFLKLLFQRTAHATKGEYKNIANCVDIFKLFAIKTKIISMLTVIIISMMSNIIGFILLPSLPIFLLHFIFVSLLHLEVFFWIFGAFYALVSIPEALLYMSQISSNTLGAYRLVCLFFYKLLKENEIAKLKQHLEQGENYLEKFLKGV